MLKRAFWLSLFCLAFFLLVGLMVQEGEVSLPKPVRVQAFFALMPAARAAAGEEQAPEMQTPALAGQPLPGQAERQASCSPRLPQGPYHQQAFHVFHYPDEAG